MIRWWKKTSDEDFKDHHDMRGGWGEKSRSSLQKSPSGFRVFPVPLPTLSQISSWVIRYLPSPLLTIFWHKRWWWWWRCYEEKKRMTQKWRTVTWWKDGKPFDVIILLVSLQIHSIIPKGKKRNERLPVSCCPNSNLLSSKESSSASLKNTPHVISLFPPFLIPTNNPLGWLGFDNSIRATPEELFHSFFLHIHSWWHFPFLLQHLKERGKWSCHYNRMNLFTFILSYRHFLRSSRILSAQHMLSCYRRWDETSPK